MLRCYPLACALLIGALLCSPSLTAAAKKAEPAASASHSDSAVKVLTDKATGTVRVIVGGEEILRAEKSGYYEVRVPRAAAVKSKAALCDEPAKESTEQGAGNKGRSRD